MKQFLRVYQDLNDKEPVFVNVSHILGIGAGEDEGDMITIGYTVASVANTGFVHYDDWTEFQRVHVIGVPRRTQHADIHLAAISDALSELNKTLNRMV